MSICLQQILKRYLVFFFKNSFNLINLNIKQKTLLLEFNYI